MVFTLVRMLLIALGCTMAGMSSVHALQAQRYQLAQMRRELRHNSDRLTPPDIVIALVAAGVNWYLPILLSVAIPINKTRVTLCNHLVLVLFMLAVGALFWRRLRIPRARPFAFTRRVCRLTILIFLFNLAGCALLNLLSLSVYFMLAGAEYVVLAAAVCIQPLEERINAGFFKAAQQKLAAHKGLIRIGITGSRGKTDTKMILRGMLSEHYRVLATPPSFSTAMGISRIVNEELNAKHQVFIAEMGAQHKGDIRELVRLVQPQYGVLTCVGKAHLDSFGSLENISQTKYELIQGLPESGAAFFGSDGSYGDRLYAMCKKSKYRAGLGTETACYMWADALDTGAQGSAFDLICTDGARIRVHTRLLGRYNVRNIALAAAVARKLDLTMEEIAGATEKLKPAPHHLQLIEGEIHVIDDSANQLPEAGAEALWVLSSFPGRRILVTTGFTELEGDGADENYAFGTQIADCADYVVLIDPQQTRPIVRGLMSKHYPKSALRVVRDEADAAALLSEIAEAGDSILYECVYPQEMA